MLLKLGHYFLVMNKWWKHSIWNANAKFPTYTGLSILPMQRHQRTPGYHLSWNSSDDVVCPYSATQLRLTQGLLHMTPFTVKLLCHPVIHMVGTGLPHAHWTDQIRNNTGLVAANLWRQAVLWGHGGAMQRPELTTLWLWWQQLPQVHFDEATANLE